MSNDPSIFTFINQIQNKKRKYEYDKKIASAYMLSQWLSMDRSLISKVNDINKYQFLLPDEVIYEYYMDVIPRGRRFIKFIKKRKEADIKKKIEEIKSKYPEMSTKECKMMLNNRRINEN
jgi:hypothetical protein